MKENMIVPSWKQAVEEIKKCKKLPIDQSRIIEQMIKDDYQNQLEMYFSTCDKFMMNEEILKTIIEEYKEQSLMFLCLNFDFIDELDQDFFKQNSFFDILADICIKKNMTWFYNEEDSIYQILQTKIKEKTKKPYSLIFNHHKQQDKMFA